jgi:putative endonuclease
MNIKTSWLKDLLKSINVNKLVYFEETQDVIAAIAREKEIKKWRREKKNQLVNRINPTWKELSLEW